MKKQQTYYYSKTQDDDFLERPENIQSIKGDYPYLPISRFSRFKAFIAYRLIATPIAFIYTHFCLRAKFVNREVLKDYRKIGYFIYANHTQVLADALTPNIILFPKKNYTIVNADNVSLPFLRHRTLLLGALPLPEDIIATRNFIHAVETRIKQGHSILIYPEAHVWPFYTKIRDFNDSSFSYPVRYQTPVFAFTTTYQKKGRKGYKTVIYVDGPFFAPASLDYKDQRSYLYQQVLEVMKERAKLSNFEQNIYLPKESL